MFMLQYFGCTFAGVKTPLPDDPASSQLPQDLHWRVDAMPLIEPSNNNSTNTAITHYELHAPNVGAAIGGVQIRSLANGQGISFTEFNFTHSSGTAQPVYALTSGYLYSLKGGQVNPELMSGAQPQAGEEFLILKPLPTVFNLWKESLPGKVSLLQECIYLNVAPLSDADLIRLITASITEEHFKKVYKIKMTTNFEGSDWEAEYLQLFKNYEDVPIVVHGGAQIATTNVNSPDDSTQLVRMFFSIDNAWTGHEEKVKTFFRYHQRRKRMGGHPLITKLIGVSVKSGTIDVLLPDNNGNRTKNKLIKDFEDFQKNPATSNNPPYHPLALDLDSAPDHHQIIVPKPRISPEPIQNLPLRNDHELTKMKISNPLGLTITIEHDPNLINISQDAPAATELIIQLSATPNSPSDTMISITADETTTHQIKVLFPDFQILKVKFFRLRDSNPNHITDMNESKLREVLAYANEILGRQTNVYIQPIEVEDSILHELNYDNDLGDPIEETWDWGHGADELYDVMAASGTRENLQVVFVWNYGQEDVGKTYRPNATEYLMIMIDTVPSGLYLARVSDLAQTLVHECGHWFANIFDSPPFSRNCGGAYKHFAHGGTCPDGDWRLHNNLMIPKGTDGLFITIEQAQVYNAHASQVIP